MNTGSETKSSNETASRANRAKPPTKPFGPMTDRWLQDKSVPEDLKKQWIENGYSVMRGVFTKDQVNRYNAIVAKVRTEVDDGKDAQGYGDRIGQLHQKEPELLEMASNKSVLDFLKWAFNDEPILFGSLNFEKGTQQDAHIDAIFFWPEPSYSMAGCWIALEDISPDAGPLFYIPGSHKWPFYQSEHVVEGDPALTARRLQAREKGAAADVRAKFASDLGNVWTKDLRGLEAEYHSQRLPLALKAGDLVFWHSLLAHGGSPRNNPALSRRSAVFHYIGKHTKLYTFEQFMLWDNEEMPAQTPQPMNLRTYKTGLQYMNYGYFVTYPKSGQVVHSL